MSIDMLKSDEKDAARLNILSIVGNSAKRGADMVAQVLSFARGIESRQMQVQPGQLLQEMGKLTRETFPKNIEIRSHIPEDLWPVRGDSTQLHQVLVNLCVNARDAMPEGGTLTLSAENLLLDALHVGVSTGPPPGPCVMFQIEDNGTGMPPQLIERIFDPFFTTKDVGKGTGLGLSTSLAIVRSHGGYIQVYSEVGNGTKFKIYLPGDLASVPDSDPELAAEMPHGDGQLILVVDDEAPLRLITRHTLEAYGYRVVLAADGAEAVAIYASRHEEIDAVLTDMMMPEMDGPAAIPVLQRIDPDVRIIAASGLSAGSAAAKLGVDHFLPKPYTAEMLLNALRDVLANHAEASKGMA
jgi:CheY-like chemotaxis protein